VTLWEEWIEQTAEILTLYDDLYEIETGESAGEATAAGPSKEALLRRKREWGEMNTEFVDVVPEFGALESPHWDRCPACGARDGVWFTSDRAECAACDKLWEKQGLLRKRWVITHGDAEGQKDTLAGWRDRAQSRFGYPARNALSRPVGMSKRHSYSTGRGPSGFVRGRSVPNESGG
jgi:hypothetical protein